MIHSPHASQEELQYLLQSTEESEPIQRIGEHVHHCPQCRQALEALAAQSRIWRQAPALLKEASANRVQNVTGGGHPMLDEALTSDQPLPDWNTHGPVADLLDRPSHPEMLGRIGKYDVESEIGRGGMGVVLKAYDADLNRAVAIKVLAPHLASHGTARRRFAQEAMAAGGILHPNVIPVYGVNHEAKHPFIVMPFVDGPSLQTLVDQQGPLSEIEITRVALQISSGLAAAHAQGLVHRDIKPANILVDGGVHRVMITDFGLARAEDDASLTRTGWLMGTPNYMSPEQTRGQRADHRSDLFSLGSLIYFLAGGRLPFRSESALGVLHRIQTEDPTPIRQINPLISATLAAVISKLLKKEPEARFQSATELHELLEQHLAYLHQPDIIQPPNVHTEVSQPILGKPAIAMALVLILIGGVTAWSYTPWSPWSNRLQDIKSERTLSELAPASHMAFDQEATLLPQPARESQVSNRIVDNSFSSSLNDAEDDQATEPPRDELTTPAPIVPSEGQEDAIGQTLFCEAEELSQQKRYHESMAVYRQAAEYANVKAKAFYNIACLEVREGQIESAFDFLRQAVENGYADEQHYRRDPDLKDLRQDDRFAQILARIQELNRASELISKAKRESENGDYAAAEKIFREALSIQSSNDDAAIHLGYVIHMQGRYDDALPWHERASKSANFKDLGHYNLACLYSIKGDSDQAFDHLRQAIHFGLGKNLSVAQLKKDPDLQTLRQDPRFKTVLTALEESKKDLPSAK